MKEHCEKRCIMTAWQFHDWLQRNDFEIVRNECDKVIKRYNLYPRNFIEWLWDCNTTTQLFDVRPEPDNDPNLVVIFYTIDFKHHGLSWEGVVGKKELINEKSSNDIDFNEMCVCGHVRFNHYETGCYHGCALCQCSKFSKTIKVRDEPLRGVVDNVQKLKKLHQRLSVSLVDPRKPLHLKDGERLYRIHDDHGDIKAIDETKLFKERQDDESK
jgi:hypothetical protein